MKTIELNNVVWKEGKHFVAQCLNVDVSSFGDSKDEALRNLDEAIVLRFQDKNEIEVLKIELPELVSSTVRIE